MKKNLDNNIMNIAKEMWAFCHLAFKIKPHEKMNDYNLYLKIKHINKKSGSRIFKPPYIYALKTGKYAKHIGVIGISNICIHKKNKLCLVFAFKGTEGFWDWMNDLIVYPTQYIYDEGKVHSGFTSALNQLIESNLLSNSQVKYIVQKFISMGGHDIYITGHSKGGALAILSAKVIEQFLKPYYISNPYHLNIITFGAPKMANKEFFKYFPYSYTRYESTHDIVPKLNYNKNFIHNGSLIQFNGYFKGILKAHNKDYPTVVGYPIN